MNRRNFIKTLGGGMAAMTLAGCSSTGKLLGTKSKSSPFSIIVLPDTQYYSLDHPEMFKAQTEWIRDHKDEFNIAFVVHAGDITNNNTKVEWDRANEAISLLDGHVPIFLNTGNHDQPEWGGQREVTLFNDYFPVSKYQDSPHFGGVWKEGLENAWWEFKRDGISYLILCLEFGPRDEVVAWANKVVEQHPNHRVIVSTHCYMYSDDTRVGEGDDWNPHTYGCGGNDGEELWTKLVSRHPNIFLVLSGHILHDGLGRLSSVNEHGLPVHQILANYQILEKGGLSYLRIMTIHPELNQIEVKTYSPALDKYATDPQNQFIIKNAFQGDYTLA